MSNGNDDWGNSGQSDWGQPQEGGGDAAGGESSDQGWGSPPAQPPQQPPPGPGPFDNAPPPQPGQQQGQQGVPQQGAPQPGTPQQGAPQQGAPQRGAPQQGAPQQGFQGESQNFGQPGQPPQGEVVHQKKTGADNLETNDIIALIASFLLPGVGHMILGQTTRGIVILAGVILTCGAGYIISLLVVADCYFVALTQKYRAVGDWEFFPDYNDHI